MRIIYLTAEQRRNPAYLRQIEKQWRRWVRKSTKDYKYNPSTGTYQRIGG